MNDSDIITVGRFGAPFGVRGWVHCQSFTAPVDNLLNYQPWLYQDRTGVWQVVPELSVRRHKKAFVAKLSTHEAREDVETIRGFMIGVHASALPETSPGEVYFRDLVGCVVLSHGERLGCVTQVMETAANEVLVIHGPSGEVLIPFVDPYVVAVDIAAKTVEVDWQADWS